MQWHLEWKTVADKSPYRRNMVIFHALSRCIDRLLIMNTDSQHPGSYEDPLGPLGCINLHPRAKVYRDEKSLHQFQNWLHRQEGVFIAHGALCVYSPRGSDSLLVLQMRGGKVSEIKRCLSKSIAKEICQKKAKFSTPEWFREKMCHMNNGECRLEYTEY
jgi:hypothetical protein